MYSDFMPYVAVAFMVWVIYEILAPFLARKRPLVSFYGFFLLGGFLYIGISGFDYALNKQDFRGISESAFMYFYMGLIAFYVSFVFSYRSVGFYDRTAKKVAGYFPDMTTNTFWGYASVCCLLVLLIFTSQLSGLTAYASSILSFNASVFLAVFSFYFARIQRFPNPLAWAIFFATFVFCFYLSMTRGSGRRDMVSCLAVIPVCVYWLYYHAPPLDATKSRMVKFISRTFGKSKSATVLVMKLAILGTVILLLLNGYSGVRYRFKNQGLRRDFAYHMETIRTIPEHLFRFPDTSQMLGQHAVNLSLTIIDRYYIQRNSSFEIRPLHTPIFVLVNPIPRKVWPKSWPEKPESLGTTYPRDAGYWKRGYVNVGPGIIGQCFQEGGLYIALIYGFFGGIIIRFLDRLLQESHGNPLMLGMLASSAGSIMGMSRGCISVFSVEFVATSCTLVGILIMQRVLTNLGLMPRK